MKTCGQCGSINPDLAKYCMSCASELPRGQFAKGPDTGKSKPAWNLFWWTLGGSLLLTWVMVVVLHLPIFFLGVLLPLVWFSRKK